ncbi:MAG: mitochondrial fission ELM1 family protein [Burkholderiales bacterium]|nr:mitochondrial fission ELM1 family protein [Burkholderiales bacterium]
MSSPLRNQDALPLLQTAEALGVECLTFGVAPGVAPNGKPPVRIFLGTEEAQGRAERVFLYTVHKHRDAARVYQVYLMKELPGFDRRTWRTGFTQYRFAIPELAGGHGRAIYNDVDQIYLADPAALFDLDLKGCGYRAVAANDTSVMVMDCARMLPWWNVGAARASGKRELVDAPAAEPGLWGVLDGGWNARDFEYRRGASKLLHYTTLHLQPWRPTPGQYSYHPHPLASLWQHLEREADAMHYQPFTQAHPSAAYRRLLSAGQAPLLPAAGETVSVGENLERLPAQDRAWFLDAVFARAQAAVQLRVDVRAAITPADRAPVLRITAPAQWWREGLAQAAEHRPEVAWTLDLIERDGTRSFHYQPPRGAPRVWVLLGRHEGDNRQLLALAEALGWPFETRRLDFKRHRILPNWLQGGSLAQLDRIRSESLGPPWPDLVLACGRRSAPVARWIGRRSAGTARLVHLGRPQAPLAAFDLVVTTPQYRLPGRDNVVYNVLPLNRTMSGASARAAASWAPRLEHLPRPWIALLVGGNSSSSELSTAVASRLRGQAEALARERGGSLLIATSPRTPPPAADIVLADSAVPGVRYRWRARDPDNPYALFLDRADELIVTGDSASMLAEACALGRPVHYVALPWPARRRRLALAALRLLAGRQDRLGERGTPKQQGRIGRWRDRLLAAGVLRPPRDLSALHEALRWSGLAQPLGEPGSPLPGACDDLERTVAAVRRLLLSGRAARS